MVFGPPLRCKGYETAKLAMAQQCRRALETLSLKNTDIFPRSQKTSDSFSMLIPSGLKLADSSDSFIKDNLIIMFFIRRYQKNASLTIAMG